MVVMNEMLHYDAVFTYNIGVTNVYMLYILTYCV